MYEAAVQVSPEDRRLIALLENPVALIDTFGRVLAQNAAFQACQKGAVTRSLQEFLTPPQAADYAAFATSLADTAQTSEPQFDVPVTLDGLRYRMVLSPRHPGPDGAVILCQLLRVDPTTDMRHIYLMEHLDQGVWDYDVASDVFLVSKVWRVMHGIVDDAQIMGLKDGWLADVHPDDRAHLSRVFEDQTRGITETIEVQYRHKHADGHWMWILCRAKVVEKASDGTPLRIIGTDKDVTELQVHEREMRDLTNKFDMALDVAGIGVWEYNIQTDEVHWGDRLLEIYGRSDEDNIRPSKAWERCIHPDDRAATVAEADHCLHTCSDFKRDYRILRPDGEVRHVRSLSRYVVETKLQDKLIGVNIDVTDEHVRNATLEKVRDRLEYDSRHDALTGLANRRMLDERAVALSQSVTPDQRYGMLILDLDHFKQINDTLGHAAGDAVLVHVADQLRAIIADRGLTSRSGGDEFVVLFERAPDKAALRALCKKIIEIFQKPIAYEGHDCMFGVSIGCAIAQGPTAQVNELFVQADAALYAAKSAGRGCYRVYSAVLAASLTARYSARQAIVDALSNAEILCYFQPQYSAQSAKLIGAEALVRWQCPDRGLLAPDAFMWQADKGELTDRVDAHVLTEVTALQSRWFADGLPYPPISVNISKARFDAQGMIEHVRSLIRPHHAIVFELLETAFLDDLSQAQLARIAALRALGIGVDMDDFGTGHSSVAAMQVVRPDRIKVDQRLVAPIVNRAERLETLRLLTEIARLEGVGIVIEGLDTPAHLAAIKPLDCDVLQGHALQAPMSAADFEQLLRAS